MLKALEISLRQFQDYEALSDPDADKKWKKSVEDYKKGTGRDQSWMGEAINEEEITGYIEPTFIMQTCGRALKKSTR